MFQWNQTYIVNSVDAFKAIKDTKTGTNSILQVKNATELKGGGIVAAYRTTYEEPVNGSVSFDWSKIADTFSDSTMGRIKMYVRLSGSVNSYFANDMSLMGKPFVYEFKKTDGSNNVAKLINSINTLYGEKLFNVTGDGNEVIIRGNRYTMFSEAVVEKYVESKGTWEFAFSGIASAPVNGFGTYEQVQKDLRLPTAENTTWGSISSTELPVPGAKYSQYTIEYCNEVGVQGTAHVGDVVTAKTTHSFFVVVDANNEFEDVVKSVLTASNNQTKIVDSKTGEESVPGE